MRKGNSPLGLVGMTLGFSFLYLPIALLIIGSFNAGKAVNVWSGWSLHWYAQAFRNEQLVAAIWVSLQVGVAAASIATLIGTAGAFALTRLPAFHGRTAFRLGLLTPLVIPEVILGLSLLLLFVRLDLDRGLGTVILAHATFGAAYVAVVVSSRLSTFDRSMEEAAMDLGATPMRAFFRVTLPIVLPAVLAGWLLAFTLSLDDLVIASFTTGPGSATLPIRIYSEVRLGVKPEINAICTLVIGLIAVVIVVASLASKLSSDRGESAAPL